MHKNEIKKEMDALIDSIKKQADRMNNEQNFSGVELELFHHKIQKLYEKSILIHHLPAKPETPPYSYNEQKSIFPERATDLKIEEPLMKEEPLAPVNTPSVKTEVEEKKQTEEKVPVAETKPVVDLFGNTHQSGSKVTTKIKTEKEKPVANTGNRIARKPIPDLKAAISINDKFRFINDLFGGNATEYHIALNQINTCSGYEEADIYLSNIKDIYKWDGENEVVSLFLELAERRFL